MIEKDSLMARISLFLLKVVMVLVICYFVITEYGLRWYLVDHYEMTNGVITGRNRFENGGFVYEYEFVVEGITYSSSSLPNDSRVQPVIGDKCLVKFIPFYPSVSKPEF